MRLIYKPESRIIVTFPHGLEGEVVFADDQRLLREEMEKCGIVIPLEMMDEYPELKERHRQVIYLKDKSFGKAFYEVYYRDTMNPTKFVWENM